MSVSEPPSDGAVVTARKPIAYDVSDGIARIIFDDPENRNAVTAAFAHEFARVTELATTDSSVRVILLGARGSTFSVGGDIREFLADEARIGDHLRLLTDLIHAGVRHLVGAPVPVVVALNGMAAGGGFSMALTGDLVIAKRSAKLNSGYTRSALTPDAGLTWLLPRMVGHARAFEIIALNETLSAEQARELGIVNRVVDDDAFDDEIERLVRRLAEMPLGLLGAVKRLLHDGGGNNLATHLDAEADAIVGRVETPETRDVLSSFIRKP